MLPLAAETGLALAAQTGLAMESRGQVEYSYLLGQRRQTRRNRNFRGGERSGLLMRQRQGGLGPRVIQVLICYRRTA